MNLKPPELPDDYSSSLADAAVDHVDPADMGFGTNAAATVEPADDTEQGRDPLGMMRHFPGEI